MSRVGVNIKFPAELHRERDTMGRIVPEAPRGEPRRYAPGSHGHVARSDGPVHRRLL